MRKVIVLLLTVLLIGSLATAAFAAPSKEADVEYTIEIIYDFKTPEPGGTVTVKEGDEYVLVPKDKDGYEFDTYDIKGEYELVKKDGNKWTIIPKGDLVVHVRYKGVPSATVPTDKSNTSPRTGDNTMLIMSLMVLGLCGVVLSVRKLSKSH